jgi:hypothetical protein
VQKDPSTEEKPSVKGPKLLARTESPSISENELRTFLQCPRKYFLSFKLKTGGHLSQSLIFLTHSAVRKTVSGLIGCEPTPPSSFKEEARIQYEKQWLSLNIEGDASEYHDMGWDLIEYYLQSRENFVPHEVEALPISYKNGTVHIQPDEVLKNLSTNRIHLRWIRTGRPAEEDLWRTLMYRAARQKHPECCVEVVYLASQEILPIEPVQKRWKRQQHNKKVEQVLEDIRTGHFPKKPEWGICPDCSNFIFCDSMPSGMLKK